MDPADIYIKLREAVRSSLSRYETNSWFTYNFQNNEYQLMKLSDTLAIPKQQFASMGVSFDENGTSPTLDFQTFKKFVRVSDRARTDNLETIQRQRSELISQRQNYHGLQTRVNIANSVIGSQRENCNDLQNQLNIANSEITSKNDLLDLKEIELKAKDELISHLQATQKQATSPNKFHFITSPRIIIPVGTVTILEVVAHQTHKPKLAPSFWAKKGVCVVGKFPLKVWNSIFDSTASNPTTDGIQDKDETVSSTICDEKAIFDLSLNSEYKPVQLQGVSLNPPTGLIRPSYISLFSFKL